MNLSWCSDIMVLSNSCSLQQELLAVKCHPFYLLRELASIIMTAVYIPSQANMYLALDELHEVGNKHSMPFLS